MKIKKRRVKNSRSNDKQKEVGIQHAKYCCPREKDSSDFLVAASFAPPSHLKNGATPGTSIYYSNHILNLSTSQFIWFWSMTPPLLLKHFAARHSSSFFILFLSHSQYIKKCLLLSNSSRPLAPSSFATLVSYLSYQDCIENKTR